ncbi:MAG TPA: ABC transporter permease [Oscillospiraceae bacterium]|nr:ABC transporter permease [Oscillospiraceae bacterium]
MKRLKKDYLAIPVLTWIGLLVGIPLVFVVVLSFLSKDNLGNVVFRFTLDNYRKILDPIYLRVFWNSFLLAGLTGFITLLIGYPVAYITANLKERGRSISLVLIMLPFWISSLLRTYGWVILLGNTGIINNLLMKLNIIKTPIQMMYKFSTTLVGNVYMLLPFMIIAIFNSVDKLDKSLLEASYDLGGSKIQTFLNITLPLTLPGIAGGFTIVFIPALGLFFISDLLGGGKIIFLGNIINTQLTRGRNKPLAAAFSIGMIIMVLAVLLIYNRLTKDSGEELF